MGSMENADVVKGDEQGDEVVEQRDEPQVVEQRDEPWAVVDEQGVEQRDEVVEQRVAIMDVPGFNVFSEFQNKYGTKERMTDEVQEFEGNYQQGNATATLMIPYDARRHRYVWDLRARKQYRPAGTSWR